MRGSKRNRVGKPLAHAVSRKMAKTFRAVAVSALSNNGQSTPKYNKPVTLNINYDPQGLSIELVSGTDAVK